MGLFRRPYGKKEKSGAVIESGAPPHAAQKNPYELVNKRNAVKPNYDLSSRKFGFDIYVSYAGEICIMGRLDENYICGLSFSTVDDLERTQAIVDGMANSPHTIVTHEYRVLGNDSEMRDKWYRFSIETKDEGGEFLGDTETEDSVGSIGIESEDGERLYHLSGSDWYCPRYLLARTISDCYSRLLKTCEERMAGGLYMPVLQRYHALLSKHKRSDDETCHYYYEMERLIDIVHEERYLKLSQDAAVRDLYNAVANCAEELYQGYMDVAR